MLLVDDLTIDLKSFLTKDARLIFAILRILRQNKCVVCDEVSVLTYVPENIRTELEGRGGFKAIKNLADCVSVKNFDSYLDTLLKDNVVLNMFDFGFNLLEPIDYKGKMIAPVDLFKYMTCEEVTNFYQSKLDEFSIGYSSTILEEEELDISDEFVESLKLGEESGTPIEYFDDNANGDKAKCLPYFSKQINGIPRGLTIVGGYSNVGKTTLVI